MARKKSKTTEKQAFNVAELFPAVFGQLGYVGPDLISKFAIECALNQGLATGVRLMKEGLKRLPIALVSAAVRPSRQRALLRPQGFGALRPLPHPLLVKLESDPDQYFLIAGDDLIRQAKDSGATEIDCMVIPYAEAMICGRALIDDFTKPLNGHVTLIQTTPSNQASTQGYAGKDCSEKPLDTSEPAAEAGPHGTPAISQTKVVPGVVPAPYLLLPRAIHEVTVVDGEVIVRANESYASPTAKAMLERANGQALDIIIEHKTLQHGRAGISLHEFALSLFIRHLFQRAKQKAILNPKNYSGQRLASDRIGNAWPGSPDDFQNWVRARAHLWTCRNGSWAAPIPDALFERCAALRYNCIAAPSPEQLDTYLYDLIKISFKALDLAGRQTSILRQLHAINASSKDRPPQDEWRRIINESVDGLPNAEVGKAYLVEEADRFMLAVLGRLNTAKIWRDEGDRTLMYQWLCAIGNFARTGKMIVSCLMAQEFVIVDRERRAGREIDRGWTVFDAALAVACAGRCSPPKAYRELKELCLHAMINSCGMIVSRTQWGDASLLGTPLDPLIDTRKRPVLPEDRPVSTAAEVPILLF